MNQDKKYVFSGLLYRDRISEVERNEVDYIGRITQGLDFSLESLGEKSQAKCEFFPWDITEKRRLTILASFQKLCPGTKTPKKDELIILGSPLGPNSQADLLKKKINELENVNGIVEKLDAHYGFLC